VSRELTPAEHEFIGDLSPTELGILEALQTEQRAYENLMTYASTDGYTRARSYAWGYLAGAVKHRSLEEIQAVQRGLDRALKEITP